MTKTAAFAMALALLAAAPAIAQPRHHDAQPRHHYAQPRHHAPYYAQPRYQPTTSVFSSGFGPPTGGIEDQQYGNHGSGR